MIEVVDADAARGALAAGALSCLCGGRLALWGRARERTVTGLGRDRRSVRPDRARCRSCRATHVLLPADLLHGCAYRVQVVGAVLLRQPGAGTAHDRRAAIRPGLHRGPLDPPIRKPSSA